MVRLTLSRRPRAPWRHHIVRGATFLEHVERLAAKAFMARARLLAFLPMTGREKDSREAPHSSW
jgi:hypothetical protein